MADRAQHMRALQRALDEDNLEAAGDIKAMILQLPPETPPQAPYTPSNMPMAEIGSELMSGLTTAVSEAGEAGDRIIKDYQQGIADPKVSGMRMGVEAVLPAAGESVLAGGKALRRVAGSLTPDVIEEPLAEAALYVGREAVNKLQEVAQFVSESEELAPVLNMAKESWSAFQNFKNSSTANAELVRSAGNLFDFGLIATSPTKVSPLLDKSNLGKNLTMAGLRQERKTRREGIKEMLDPIIPEDTKGKVILTGPLRTKTVVPDQLTEDSIDVLTRLKAIDPKATYTDNKIKLREAINSEAVGLINRIKAKGNPKIDKKNIMSRLEDEADLLLNSEEFAVAGATPSAIRAYFNIARQKIRESDGTAVGLLQARKEIDDWLEDNLPKALDFSGMNAKTLAVGKLRDVLNSTVAEIIPDLPFTNSLRRQHLMYVAYDTVAEKARGEARNAIGRSVVNIQRTTGVNVPVNFLGVAGTVGLMGQLMSSGTASYLTAGLSAAYAAYIGAKIVTSAQTKKILGATLSGINKAIKATENQEMIAQLKADRLVVISLLKQKEETEPTVPYKRGAYEPK
jgi:hypothetical protein